VSFPERVRITESSSRDGLQSLGAFIPTEAKSGLINDLAATGIVDFDAVSFVSPRWVPQMADGAEVVAGVTAEGVTLGGLVPNIQGLENALAAGISTIGVLTAASDTFNERNINATVDESMHRIRRVILETPETVTIKAYVSTATHCPYEGEQDPDWVAHLAETLIEWGAHTVHLGETIGKATPYHMERLLPEVLGRVPVERLGVHLHDTYGQAIANTMVALEYGVTMMDASAGSRWMPICPGGRRQRRHRRCSLPPGQPGDQTWHRPHGSRACRPTFLFRARSCLQQQGWPSLDGGRGTRMKSIYINEDLEAIRAGVREFVEREIVPNVEAWEEQRAVPRDLLNEMGKLGFFGLRVPEEFGGVGLGHIASVIFAEELGRCTAGGTAITILVHTDLASPYMTNFGRPEQKDRWVPKFVSGEAITAIGVTEPDTGSDVASIRTTARRDGDGWVLNGTKMFITNGGTAEVVFIAAKTNPDVKGSRGISMFLVEKGTEGFSQSRALKKMGWHSSNTAELVLEDVWVPAENLVGEENQGFYYIMQNFQNERLTIMGQALGESQKALEITLDYVKERKAFGVPLWEKQTIRQRLAMRQAEVDAARELTYKAAWMMDEGIESVREVSEVKALVGELANRVLYDCVQFHGGMGFVAETEIERMYRDVRIGSIGGGATEVMLDEVAKRL